MNWINNVVRPKISGLLSTAKRDVPDNLWVKCPESGQMVFYKDLEANAFVVPGSNYHMRMGADQRLRHLFDSSEYKLVAVPSVQQDPLKFRDGRKYTDRLKDAKADTKLEDAVLVGEGLLQGQHVVAAAQDFRFMAGSLGMAAGEAIIAGMLKAVDLKTPFILFAASGGARMQEGILSLMQMPRTTIAVQRLRDAKLPYIVVLTDPTTGGVTASYAMLGDIHIAEPGALICFAGPRVIQQTIREQLPDGFQRAEYLLAHGMVDMVVHRHQLRETLARLCGLFMSGINAAKGKDARRANGKSYVNGSSVDGKVIETAARESGGVIEPEAVPPSQRFDPARTDKAKRDGSDAASGAGPASSQGLGQGLGQGAGASPATGNNQTRGT
ncbi:MAG: acetyl-CoA carboxylase, carboxyltransferase subunit beta [Hyphomicrobium sp.]|nr:acetyl-CoA carboxylase, carboxyltransferase subunit beta [Hyphomicrobium sp.]